MSRAVLMVAFHFPPFSLSTGLLRTVSFARELPDHGWTPLVLTASPRAYGEAQPATAGDVVPGLAVHRAFALDVQRHLSIGGAYPGWMATPDRWSSWLLGAIPKGLALIRRHRPALIWSTYPISSAVLIGLALHRISGVPWVLDLRDPLLYDAWPEEPRQRRVHGWIERRAVRHAAAVVVTTPGAARLYSARYPELGELRWRLIANGVDEGLIRELAAARRSLPKHSSPVRLVHSGLMEVPDRDPSAFFEALARLRAAGRIGPGSLEATLRGSAHDDLYRPRIERLGLADAVRLAPRVAHREALQEMVCADGLLLFQGSACNDQIPAKAYEYLAAERPILGLVDPGGDTFRLLREWGVPYLAEMDSPEAIAAMLEHFLADLASGGAHVPGREILARHTRRARAAELAALFDEVAAR